MRYKIFKSRLSIFLFIPLVVLIGCQSISPISIDVDENDFPVIILYNPYGEDVTLTSPGPETGSIGYLEEGSVHWIKGLPDKAVQDIDDRQYMWITEQGDSVVLTIIRREGFELIISVPSSEVNGYFVNLEAQESEYFTGIFERVVDGSQRNSWANDIKTGLNLRGEQVEMKLKPTVSAYAPFYISSNNYSIFVKGTWPGVFDFCSETDNNVKVFFEGPSLNFTISMKENPMELVKEHALATGPSVVPPDWALGPWRWRDEHKNNPTYFDGTPVTAPYNSEIVEDVLMMKFFDIPAKAVWIDRPWGPGSRGFDDYKIDTDRLPDFEKMVSWLNRNNLELMLWIGPFVMGDQADYAEEKGYDLVSKGWMNSRQVLMDFTNPEAVRWWGENGPGKLARMGVKGFKLDRADGEKLVDSLHLITHSGITYRENYNDYPHQYVKATYEAVQPVLGDDFILFPRAQYTGSAKYGGMWAGDTDGKPEGLRSAVIGMQRCAVMGYPVWGSDIGGYWGQFNRESCMRWLGFGCFSPLMETGPTRNRGFWDMDSEPHMDTMLIATWRLYSKTREKLMPYLKELAVEANTTGTPIARPLFLQYPHQPEAWDNWQTYMLGPDILVSVIWEKNRTEHKLYLPEGEVWIDAWDKKQEYEGGQFIKIYAPLYKTPVFIRKGSDIDLGDLEQLYKESLEIAKKPFNLSELENKESW